jgi:magnesium-protoporphyrin IX monomethyl ester (oxidative) cyclase
VSLDENMRALEVARSLDIFVAINIIADPSWDEDRFRVIREWATSVPEIVHLTVITPYPGTETWLTEERPLTSRDYRLFDIQHAVLPTTLPLDRFYEELVKTQAVLNSKYLGLAGMRRYLPMLAGGVLRGQTNLLRGLWKFPKVYNAKRQLGEHARAVKYELTPPEKVAKPSRDQLYVSAPLAGGRGEKRAAG